MSGTPAFPRHVAGGGRLPDLWAPSRILCTLDGELRNGKCEMAFVDNNLTLSVSGFDPK